MLSIKLHRIHSVSIDKECGWMSSTTLGPSSEGLLWTSLLSRLQFGPHTPPYGMRGPRDHVEPGHPLDFRVFGTQESYSSMAVSPVPRPVWPLTWLCPSRVCPVHASRLLSGGRDERLFVEDEEGDWMRGLERHFICVCEGPLRCWSEPEVGEGGWHMMGWPSYLTSKFVTGTWKSLRILKSDLAFQVLVREYLSREEV